MSGHSWEKDLVVLAADKGIEMAIRGILTRQESLGICCVSTAFLVHPAHDPGCVRTPEVFLRPYISGVSHALVVLDHEGSGHETLPRTELELQIENLLKRNGWDDRAAVIVIAPELENWVWSDSSAVAEKLGWQGQLRLLRSRLEDLNLWHANALKPEHPKDAMTWALREVRKPRSSAIYRELAENVGLQRCSDPAFQKLRTTLQKWFPRD